MKHVCPILISVLYSIILYGCIHEYPGPDAYDPTLVNVAIKLAIPPDWKENTHEIHTRENTDFPPHRIVVEAFRNGKSEGRYELFISKEEYLADTILFKLPFTLHAVEYNLTVWTDIANQESDSSFYNVTDLSKVTPSSPMPLWTAESDCSFVSEYIDLRGYREKWNSKVIIPLQLSKPIARFEIATTNLKEFLDYTVFERQHGETYTLTLSSNDKVINVFDAVADRASSYTLIPDLTIPLSAPGHPPDRFPLISGSLLLEEETSHLDAIITVYNSARIIMARSSEFTIPLERGKTTLVTGNFLTNFYTNNINVNNIWDGEILIEI